MNGTGGRNVGAVCSSPARRLSAPRRKYAAGWPSENRAGHGRREAAYLKVCGRLRTPAREVFAAGQAVAYLRRGALRRESGQVIALVAVVLVVLLGFAAAVIDVGYAFYAKRSLQASADAAALAGAMELPDPAAAASVAQQYSGAVGSKNERGNIPVVTTSVTTKCLSIAPCGPVNAIVVNETAQVETLFARVLGIDTFAIHARSTACSPCGSRPLDIMLLLDRTGSMCQDTFGNSDPSCTDLNNARIGMKTFLEFMDPSIQWVGLAVLPPATSVANRCATPTTTMYNTSANPYVIVPLSSNYKLPDGTLNPGSSLVSTINCQKGGGRTAYATALEKTQTQLVTNGRAGVQDVIVFLSDGAANIGPTYYSSGSPYRTRPCHQGVSSAATIKTQGTLIYTIGYDLDAEAGTANVCTSFTGALESPAITATAALQQIATDPSTFFNQPNPGQLNTIFTAIASEIAGAKLIDDATQ